jgi:hypothetical protein
MSIDSMIMRVDEKNDPRTLLLWYSINGTQFESRLKFPCKVNDAFTSSDVAGYTFREPHRISLTLDASTRPKTFHLEVFINDSKYTNFISLRPNEDAPPVMSTSDLTQVGNIDFIAARTKHLIDMFGITPSVNKASDARLVGQMIQCVVDKNPNIKFSIFPGIDEIKIVFVDTSRSFTSVSVTNSTIFYTIDREKKICSCPSEEMAHAGAKLMDPAFQPKVSPQA